MNILRLSVLCLLLTLSAGQSRAAVGASTGGAGIIVGILTMTVGYEGVTAKDCGKCILQKIYGGLMLAAGAVMLNEETGELDFAKISVNDFSKEDQITNMDIEIYHSELEELNAIKNNIHQMSKENSELNITQAWKEHFDYLSPETVKVAQAIAKNLAE